MAISSDELRHLADLARIAVSEGEMTTLGADLEKILGYVGRLSKIDTTGVPETENGPEVSVLDVDIAAPVEACVLEALVENFPDRVGNALRVPAVFEHPKQ
jgi:aspartyl-tRNA(Asn)/glutamyl-tRNA(Gln) amidotransferase subunit C